MMDDEKYLSFILLLLSKLGVCRDALLRYSWIGFILVNDSSPIPLAQLALT